MKGIAVRAAVTIAAIYGYFLIFAQFAFVELLRSFGHGPDMDRLALGLMALAGIAGGFLIAWGGVSPWRIRGALVAAAIAALVAPYAGSLWLEIIVALVTGVALGVATVGLATLLRGWCSVFWVGLGTGLGYGVCNVPWIFSASPAEQAVIGSFLAVIGCVTIPTARVWIDAKESSDELNPWVLLGVFTALVWLDSAAFFIIQHERELKAGTWGEGMLWRNAWVHLIAALFAGMCLQRNLGKHLLCAAWVVLAVAAWAVNYQVGRGLAGWIYPIGVSFYSTALIAWPAWYSGAKQEKHAGWRAAWLFGIAGWIGSANGIGMAETLQRVPVVFIVISGVVVLGLLQIRNGNWRGPLLAGAVLFVGLLFSKSNESKVGDAASMQRGRQVYLAEGCIHCHSQYPRPETADETMWGVAFDVGEMRKHERPVIIGNRRQGPDLRNIGARRSAAWLRIHFNNPRALVPDSTMPSYDYLFDDSRGEDLIAYLSSCGVDQVPERMKMAAAWEMKERGSLSIGAALFGKHCSACHGADGRGDGSLAKQLVRPPTNLLDGPFLWTAGDDAQMKIARIIKFGIAGSDMPGHEVMTDPQVDALTREVLRLRSHAR